MNKYLGAVIAAGFINAVKCIQVNLHEIRLVFFGAGSAGIFFILYFIYKL